MAKKLIEPLIQTKPMTYCLLNWLDILFMLIKEGYTEQFHVKECF